MFSVFQAIYWFACTSKRRFAIWPPWEWKDASGKRLNKNCIASNLTFFTRMQRWLRCDLKECNPLGLISFLHMDFPLFIISLNLFFVVFRL